jgi:hypothetical protein
VEGRIAHQATARGLPEDCVDVLAPQAIKRLIEPDEAAATVARARSTRRSRCSSWAALGGICSEH